MNEVIWLEIPQAMEDELSQQPRINRHRAAFYVKDGACYRDEECTERVRLALTKEGIIIEERDNEH